MNLSLGGREGGAATLRRTLHEPWQHLFRFFLLLSSTMHQPTYGSIMICWTKVRCLNKLYWTSIRAQAYFVVVWTEHIFSAYVIILLTGVLLFCTSHFGSFPHKRTDVKSEERGALYLDKSRSGCGQGASNAIMWHCESDDLIVSIKCKRGDVIN